jgi:hypothetical protein
MASFDYVLRITGDCFNSSSGRITVDPIGGVPPYVVEFVNPNLGIGTTQSNLSGGEYTIRINDSQSPTNNEFYISAIVSSGGCLTVANVTNTSCGENNGNITITAGTTSFPINVTLYSGTSIVQTGTTLTSEIQFSNLSKGLYRAYYEDYGGCSGYSESIIIEDSTEVDFGFFIVNNTRCFGDVGKLQVTGVTGEYPYTYLWGNGQTGTTITGLTAGTYSLTVTDNAGCSKTKVATVNLADTLSVGSITGTTPSCFASDGSVTLTITGGTGPFFYSGSNGSTLITYATSVTFTGFSPGNATIIVTDATLCTLNASTYLQSPGGFSIIGINTTNSVCSSEGGTATIDVLGESPFTFTLIYPDTSTQSITQVSPSISYSNLSAGTYTIQITNSNSCQYSENFTIASTNKFNLTTSLTGTSCGLNNGICYLEVGSGYTGVLDMILTKNNSPVIQYIDVPQTAVTFNNLSSGIYRLQVRDTDNCSVFKDFSIDTSNALDFGLVSTNCGNSGSGGTINVNIYNGTPPFSYLWSDNVNGQTGLSLTGLTGGTYTLKVTDYSGCSITRNITVPCTPQVSGYKTKSILSSGFTITKNTERDILSMVNEGFYDIVSEHENCVLSSATYTAFVEISGNTYTNSFYTGYTLNSVPSNNLWTQTIENIISGITGVSAYTVNLATNTVQVDSDCDGDSNTLADSEFIMGLNINYNIRCVS